MTRTGYPDFCYSGAGPPHMQAQCMPAVLKFAGALGPGVRILDVGCGKVFACGEIVPTGAKVVEIDSTQQRIALARTEFPRGRFEAMEADDGILDGLVEEPFDVVLSTVVVEHLYSPLSWAEGCYRVLKAGGRLVCTTPYHGYLKNFLLSILEKWDSHESSLDWGPHQFLESQDLRKSLEEGGFEAFRFRLVDRMPCVWMTVAVEVNRPRDN